MFWYFQQIPVASLLANLQVEVCLQFRYFLKIKWMVWICLLQKTPNLQVWRELESSQRQQSVGEMLYSAAPSHKIIQILNVFKYSLKFTNKDRVSEVRFAPE